MENTWENAIKELKDVGIAEEITWRGIATIPKEKEKGTGASGRQFKEGVKGGRPMDFKGIVTTAAEKGTRQDFAISPKGKERAAKVLTRWKVNTKKSR